MKETKKKDKKLEGSALESLCNVGNYIKCTEVGISNLLHAIQPSNKMILIYVNPEIENSA